MQVSLELQQQEEGMLSGSIATDGGRTVAFQGWLGLATVLQCLLDEQPPTVQAGETQRS